MSETQTHVHTEHTPPPLTLTKNEVSVPLRFLTETKGTGGARKFYGRDLTVKNESGAIVYETDTEGNKKTDKDGKTIPVTKLPPLAELVKIMGEDVLVKKILTFEKKGYREIYDNVMEATITPEHPEGKFDQKAYEAEFSQYSWKIVSMAALKKECDDLLQLFLTDKLAPDEYRRKVRIVKASIDRKSKPDTDDDDESAVEQPAA